MRRSVPLVNTLVPALTQIPSAVNLSGGVRSDVGFHLSNSSQTDLPSPANENAGSGYVNSDNLAPINLDHYARPQVDTSLFTARNINDVGGVRDQLDIVFDNLEPAAHPAGAALMDTVKAAARDPVVLERILSLTSFQSFVNSIAFTENRPITYLDEDQEEEQLHRTHSTQKSTTSSGTQTEEIYTDFVDTSLQSMSLQLVGLSTSTSTSTTSTTSTSTYASNPAPATFASSVGAPPASSTLSASSSPVPPSMPSNGSAGVPGNPDKNSMMVTALQFVLPLVFLTVAAAVLRTSGAINLVKVAFKIYGRKVLGL